MIGEAIMIRVPGRGEFYLALQPPAGFPFQPFGRVDHNVLRFRADGEKLRSPAGHPPDEVGDRHWSWINHVPEARAKRRVD